MSPTLKSLAGFFFKYNLSINHRDDKSTSSWILVVRKQAIFTGDDSNSFDSFGKVIPRSKSHTQPKDVVTQLSGNCG